MEDGCGGSDIVVVVYIQGLGGWFLDTFKSNNPGP